MLNSCNNNLVIISKNQFFQTNSDWQSRYKYLINLAKGLDDFPDQFKIQRNKIENCQARVWFCQDPKAQNKILAYSESRLVAGLSKTLLEFKQDQSQDFYRSWIDFLKQNKIMQNFSSLTEDGLIAMERKIDSLK